MKTYNDLTSHQKDTATDKALEVLVKMILDTEFDYVFASPLTQKRFYDAIRFPKTKSEFEIMMASDEIAEELYPLAESMAEIAFYPSDDEYVLLGIVK